MSASTRSLQQPRYQDASVAIGVASIGAVLFVLGVIGHPAMPWFINALAASVLITFAGSQVWRVWAMREGQLSKTIEIAIAALVLVTAFVLVRALQGVGSELYPVLYFTLALLVALTSRVAGVALMLLAIALEGAAQFFGTSFGATRELELLTPQFSQVDLWQAGVRAGCFLLFGGLAHLVHGAELLERRQRYQHEITQERENLLKEARQFRLIHSDKVWEAAAANRERAEELIMTDAVEAVHHSTYVSLRLLKTALGAHTCVLLWFDGRNDSLHIKELVSESDNLVEGSIEPMRGAIGGVSRRREPVNLRDLKSGYRGLSYYREAEGVKNFLGVPVIEHGHLRGILCVDRLDARPFDVQDVDMLEEAAAYILRAVQNERLFVSIEKSKYELGRFFEASRRLNGVLTPQDVWREALMSIGEITPFDLAAFTTFDPETEVHTITQVETSPDWDQSVSDWVGQEFQANGGWVSMVVKNRHYLPYGGHVRDGAPVVFGKKQRISGMRSMLVLPLIAQDKVLGTLVVGHREANRYTTERREMLEVVSNQVAVSLQSANLYACMERMATRDALTGLPNRRTFMGRIEEAVARHRRSGGTFGLILSDIDHFKSVNDTYGHPVGDEVLRQVAKAFRETLRETDMPARYGGEEFIILLEETDMKGCEILANRVREAVSALTFQSDKGPFQCTISMGIAIWPSNHEDTSELIELADQALYYSKKNGRNRVTVYDDMPSK